jgi:hypothetical protein
MTPWTGDQPDARPLRRHRTAQHRKTRTQIHASSGIRTQDPSIRAAEDSTCLRPRGHWDRPLKIHLNVKLSSTSWFYKRHLLQNSVCISPVPSPSNIPSTSQPPSFRFTPISKEVATYTEVYISHLNHPNSIESFCWTFCFQNTCKFMIFPSSKASRLTFMKNKWPSYCSIQFSVL